MSATIRKHLCRHRFALAAAVLWWLPVSCERKAAPPAAPPAPPKQAELPPAPQPPGQAAPAVDRLAKISRRLSPAFQFDKLIESLGARIAPEMVKQLEAEGWSSPEFNDPVTKGGKAYVMALQDDGCLILVIADDQLVTFGYSYTMPATGGTGDVADPFLSEFKLADESTVEVLDDQFNPASMRVKNYGHKTRATIRALAYSRNGTNRTLSFYDSSKVDASKLLPASPAAMGKDTIEKMKAMLKKKPGP